MAAGEGGIAAGRDVNNAGRDVIYAERYVNINHYPSPPPSGPGEEALRYNYLHRLVELTEPLALAGFDPSLTSGHGDARLSLDAVYTALMTLSPGEAEHIGRLESSPEISRLSALAQLNSHPGGKGLVQEAGKKLGEDAPELLKKLWAKLRPKVEEKPAAVEAVQDVAKAPEDSRTQTGLSIQLQKILEADSTLAAEIAKLLEGASPTTTYQAEMHGSGAIAQGKSVAAGAGGIAAGRDVRKGS